jgi:hypothetical protein
MTEPTLPEESIFAQALDIPSAEERAAFLDQACENNPALRNEIEALLRAHKHSGDLLDLPEQLPAAAIEEAEELAKNADSLLLYNAACVFALASKPTKANPISPEKQAKYAERAVALLRQVVAKGGSDANEMKNDDDLKPLPPRDDFQKLLRDMQK